MEKTKEEFVRFIRTAIDDQNSDAFIELYQFLLGCFNRADTDFDGQISAGEFDALIDEAAALPRRYGFAPTNDQMYANADQRKAARAKMFAEINTAKDGNISFEQWIAFSVSHITGKVATLSKDYLAGTNVSKEEFIAFIKKAVNKNTPEYKELYFFLLKCFVDADKNRDGSVNPEEFDAMIEVAAQAPRRFGLAPATKDLYKTEAERIAKRKEHFDIMDTNRDGNISFNEWLAYGVKHITGKIATV